MKTITMTLDEYNADIKRAKESAEVEKYKPLVDLVWEITAVVSHPVARFAGDGLPDERAFRPYHNWTKEEIIEKLRRVMGMTESNGYFDGLTREDPK
jgi:hypothetical protein